MTQLTRRRRTPRTAARTAVVALALIGLALGPGAIASASGPRNAAATVNAHVRVIGPGQYDDSLQTAMGKLVPGDILELEPGTYDTGYLRMYALTGSGSNIIRKGTAAAPITLTSVDPSHPAVLSGGLQLSFADYWHVSNLVFQATVPGYSALYMAGGTGWSVTGSTFTGAATTQSFANVAIATGVDPSGRKISPSRFTFSENCVYEAARTGKGNPDQNIYVSFEGSNSTSGTISRNIIYSAPNGQAVKLGNGGTPGALGPWNVVVSNNTMVSNGRQVLLFGNVRNNRIVGNLFMTATAPFTRDPRTTQVYVAALAGTHNTISANYGYAASMFTFDPAKAAVYGPNYQSNAAGADPKFNGGGCGGYLPTNRNAAQYGRYGVAH